MTWASRWALRAYPPWFRSRYGAELAALSDDVGASWRHTAGLYAGAARAWLRPAFTGADATRGRLQASVSSVWVAWCAGMLLVPAIDKALLDPPGPHVDLTVHRLLDAAGVVLVAGWVVALAAAALLAWRALVPALREGRRGDRWAVVRPLLPAVGCGIVAAAALLVLASVSRSGPDRPTTAAVVAGSVFLVGTLAVLVTSGIGPVVTLRRLHPDTTALRTPTQLAAMLALCLAASTVMCVAAVAIAGDAALVGSFAPVAAILVVGALASSTAAVSSVRGVVALHLQAGEPRGAQQPSP
jgi:hypothetical protein